MAKSCLVRVFLSAKMNSGPGAVPRKVTYCMMASTGQISIFVLPRCTWIPCLKGSIFDSFIVSWISDGDNLLSTAKSLKDR